MADVDITASFQAGNVEQGFKKIEKGTNRLQRSTRRSGMAFLEATRALEDFQFAGIRGAANNLPGLAMALGLGTGIAGMATLGALGIMQLTKAMKRFEVAMNIGTERAKAFASAMMDAVGSAQQRDAVAQLEKEFKRLNEEVEKATAKGDYVGGADAQVSALKHQIALERELAGLRGEDVDRAAQFERDAKAAEDSARVYEAALASIEARAKSLNTATGRAMEGRTTDDGSSERARVEVDVAKARLASAEEFLKSGGAKIPDGIVDYAAGGIGDAIRKIFQQETNVARRKREAQKLVNDAKQQLAEKRKVLSVVEKTYKAEEDALKKLKDAQEGLAEDRLNAERKIAEAMQEAAEARMKAEAVQQAKQDQSEMRLSTPILTSQGRAGLAGNEIQAAMQSLQVERNMLQELKTLVKLTKNKTGVWA